MGYPNPIGYWVAVRSDHPYFPLLAELEIHLGSFFENLQTHELHALLTYCAAKSDTSEGFYITRIRENSLVLEFAFTIIDQLNPDYKFGLLPFLCEVLKSRGG